MIRDRVSSLLFLSLSIIFLAASLHMPFGQFSEPGPGFMPLFLGIIMVLISGGLSLKALIRPEREAPSELLEKGSIVRCALLVIGLVFYCVLLPWVGFLVLTFLFEIVLLKLFGVRKWRTILAVATAVTLGSILIFETWLQVPFPKGTWWPL
jgi:hypothetical protein